MLLGVEAAALPAPIIFCWAKLSAAICSFINIFSGENANSSNSIGCHACVVKVVRYKSWDKTLVQPHFGAFAMGITYDRMSLLEGFN